MPHTRGHYRQDQGFPDGILVLRPAQAMILALANAPITRNAAGDYSANQIANVAVTYAFNIEENEVMRTGETENFSNQFGGSGQVGDAGPQFPINAMSALQMLTPRTAPKVKGIKPLSIAVAYMVNTVDLAAMTCRLDKLPMSAGAVAPVNLIPSGVNGLVLTNALNTIQVVEIPIPNAAYLTSDLSQYIFELAVTTPVGGTFRLYGIRVKVEYNFS